MNISDVGVLLRILAFAAIIVSFAFLKNRRTRGKIIFQQKTTIKRELQNNVANLNMFIITISMIIIFDDVLVDIVWNKIFMDIALLVCITVLLLLPKDVIITDKGILFTGIFRPWNIFTRYRTNRINKTIVLWRMVLLFSEKIIIPVEDIDEVEKILPLYVHEHFGDSFKKHY